MTDDDALGPDSGGDGDRHEGEGDRKRIFERVVPEILKRVIERAVDAGANKLSEGPEDLRQFLGGMKLPKEVLQYLYAQVDETKSGLYRAVAKEIRDVLEHTEIAEEITKVLTKLSFEIKTEIRFIPNDAAKPRESAATETGGSPGTLPKPEVKSRVTVRDSEGPQRSRKREGT